LKAMVLAAGVGSRLDPLTSETPKPLVPVVNVPIMEHILKLLSVHGFTDICANVHYLPERIIDYFDNGSALGLDLKFLLEENLSGDAGGIRACRKFLDGSSFLVLNGDLLTDADLTLVVREHKRKKAIATIAVKHVDDVSHFGVALLGKEGFITGFQEKPAAHEALSNLISTGIYVLEPEIFKFIPSEGDYGFGRQLFPLLVKQDLPVLGVEIDGYWSDVGTLAQYRLSNFDALQGKIKVDLPGRLVTSSTGTIRKMDSAIVEEGSVIEGDLMIGAKSIIKRGARIKGTVVIADNCVIESGAEISDSVIWSGVHILGDAKVNDSVIGSGCIVAEGTKLSNTAIVSQNKQIAPNVVI
jgi:mannose-1-phosphate guanylyltransferase